MTLDDQTLARAAPFIRARLRGLMERAGMRLHAVRDQMALNGHDVHMETVRRWLNGETAMNVDQIDQVLRAIGATRDDLLGAPVVTDVDHTALLRIMTGQIAGIAQARLERLRTEGLIRADSMGTYLTALGRDAIRRRVEKEAT